MVATEERNWRKAFLPRGRLKYPRKQRVVVVVTDPQLKRVRKHADEFDMTIIAFVSQALDYAMDNMTHENPKSRKP